MSNRMTSDLLSTALQIAIHTRQPSAGQIIQTKEVNIAHINIRIYSYCMVFNAALVARGCVTTMR